MEGEIINRVANSGLITIDLEEYYPKGDRVLFDIKPILFQELILKESSFRDFIKQENWEQYKDKYVAITCSNDAIVPTWAYMLLAMAMQPFAKKIIFGTLETLETILFSDALKNINPEEYLDKRVVIKGCGHLPIPTHAYIELSNKLKPYVKSIMYGEPCSTVPLYKAPITK